MLFIKELLQRTVWKNSKYQMLILLVLQIMCSNTIVYSFNLNLDLAKVFSGSPSTYFGYTTDFLETRENPPKKWILVGAPTAQDIFQSSINQPGALYKCDPEGTTCDQIQIAKLGVPGTIERDDFNTEIIHGKDYGWLGASLTVGDAVTVCSPRWVNEIEDRKVTGAMYYMNGICYEIPRYLNKDNVGTYALLSKSTSFSPPDLQTVNDTANNLYYFHYQYGQMGMSAQYSKQNDQKVFIGAPGLRDAAGGLIDFDLNDIKIASESYDFERNNDYFGYALTPGKFLGDGAEYIALGGPRGNGTGQVKIVQMSGAQYTVKATVSGEETGSYFGSVLCAVDVLKTGQDVLVVGAPFFGNLTQTNIDVNSINQDEGKVYVYSYDSTETNTDVNSINQDEGKVYVYSYDSTEGKMKELQQLRGTGPNMKNARFGSAICSPGDINKDGALDLAVGAPFEDDGTGVVYIFNGHGGKFWPQPTQIIKAKSIPGSLMGFGSYLSQYRLDVDDNSFNDLLIGAPYSDDVILLKSNPTISMEVSLRTSLIDPENVIQAENEDFTIQVCFKYTGAQVLPVDVTVNFTVGIDYDMTKNGKRERVLASDGSNTLKGEKKVIRSLSISQCSDSYKVVVQQHRTDIVTPVTFIVKYAIIRQAGTGQDCSSTPCPVINVFNANRQIPDADSFQEMIHFSKPGCGPDNICKTDLNLQVKPKFNYGAGVLVRGPDAGFQLEITVSNSAEASYGTTLTVDSAIFISYVRVKSTADSQTQVSCSPQNVEDNTKSILECSLSDLEVPFVTGRADKFVIYFDASRTPVVDSFDVNLKLKTRSEDTYLINNEQVIPVNVESRAEIEFDGVSNPELYVTSKTKDDKVSHRFDFTNNGPSILDAMSAFAVSYPSVVINSKALLKVSEMVIIVPVQSYLDCGADVILSKEPTATDKSGTNTTKTYKISEKNPSVDDNINYNCNSDGCKKIECTTNNLGVKAFVTILLKFEMDPNILSQVQSKTKVESLPISTVTKVSLPNSLLLSTSLSYSATAKTDVVPAEQVKKDVEWWVVVLGILGGLLVVLVVALILWKLGFFKRKQLEEIEAMKNQQKKGAGGDEENLIENGKEKEKEPLTEDTKNEVSLQDNFDELDKMIAEVKDFA